MLFEEARKSDPKKQKMHIGHLKAVLQEVNLIATLEDLGHFQSEEQENSTENSFGNSTENLSQKRLAERVLR